MPRRTSAKTEIMEEAIEEMKSSMERKSFEESLERLATIVEALEHDGTALADAMRLYEEGIALSQSCRRELEQAELRITELRARAEGDLAEEESDF